MVFEVDQPRREIRERTHSLDLRAHQHQHAPHVSVMHDGDASLMPWYAALNSVIRVGDGLLIGAFTDCDAL